MKLRWRKYHVFGAVLALVLPLLLACGQIADKDRIRVAKVDGEYITRGDLAKLLRDMSDTDRPKIRNKSDLRRVLNKYIDTRIKLPLGDHMAAEGKIKINRDLARERFFQMSGDDEEQYRSIWSMEVPPPGQTTPLMKEYRLTRTTLRGMRALIDEGTDRVVREMQAEEAVALLAMNDFQQGDLVLDEDRLQREYDLRKDGFRRWEWVSFVAIRFPAIGDGLNQAAEVRARVDADDDFNALVEEYGSADPGRVLQSEIENNPSLARFSGFWESASGAQPGDIIGPIYMPAYQQVGRGAGGQTSEIRMPDSYLVLQILEHRPEKVMTKEEAMPFLAPPLLVAEKMKRLREEHGVEIYNDKLPDPGRMGQKTGDPILDS